jgi:hypothetical protein
MPIIIGPDPGSTRASPPRSTEYDARPRHVSAHTPASHLDAHVSGLSSQVEARAPDAGTRQPWVPAALDRIDGHHHSTRKRRLQLPPWRQNPNWVRR